MKPIFPSIRLRGRGEWLAGRDGVVLVFFIHRDHSEVGSAIWRSIQTYRRAIPPGSLNWYTSSDGDMVPLDDAGWEHNRHVVIERIGGGSRTVELRESPSETGSYQVEYYGRRLDSPIHDAPATTLSFTFPTEYLLQHGAVQLRALALELARELPFNFGYVSFAIVSSRGSWASADWNQVESLLARYPGLDIPNAGEFSSRLGTHALSASWLTFLGEPLLGSLGGIHTLRNALSFPDVSLLPIAEDRLLVTLDEWPDPIDTEKTVVPPQHRALARLLKPFTFKYEGHELTPYESDMNRWLLRLLH
ncbi:MULTISPECIES: type VI immunity family protein [unclassified Corallococcus]|uniref:type VI immunity family protein n=1 Tax=unclassified Corallococcus TaxID=2685029 RepID=UPI001A8C6799|nr:MULTISPECIES: type VI immunity family protein [unclassified Corallococcus]MBN9682189.1 DUF3396 domain-containing protein [Corallococcus sp. NCSPR001]WAS86249.1 DUF3396 domain-containing protein [Corallococcus sp. NCRR]